ncbi:MAG: bifunctional riboflavin kinase/FAD synthetase [Bacteroidota bacterium]
MIVGRSLEEITRDPASVVTVGTFDGVHLAHQEIIREVVNRARMNESRSVVVTFEPHPKEVVGKGQQPVRLLSTLEERTEMIRKMHVDMLFVINFTYEFSRLTAREFYQRYVVDGIGVGEVVVGYDHMFGRDRTAGIAELVKMGQEFNFSVSAVHPYRIGGEAVGSSRVRKVIAMGDVEEAAKMLGRSFTLAGTVVHGDGRGKTIGYPTANITPLSERKLVPGRGVYLVGVFVRGRQLYGMLNIGVRPTVKAAAGVSIEVHVFNLADDIYGEDVQVTFLRKLRDEQKFTSLEELTHQLEKDKETSLRYIAEFDKRQ